MPVTTGHLIEANDKSIERLEAAEEFIDSKKGGLQTEDRFVALTLIADIETRLRVLKFTRVHLTASEVVVEFTDADAAKLTAIEENLDDFIVGGADVNAFFDSVPPILNAVAKLDALINGHIGHIAQA